MGTAVAGDGNGNGNGHSTPIAALRVIDFGGFASARYLMDEESRGAPGSGASFQTLASLEEELQLWARGYAYHPNLATWQAEGGPVLVQQTYDSSAGANRKNDVLFNFAARMDFLEKKAYPFAVYFRRGHPTLSTTLSGSFLTETTGYGASASLLEPVAPVQVEVDASHDETTGAGLDRRIDDTLDIASIRFSKSYRKGDWVRLDHTRTRQESASGSPNLPVLQSLTRTDSTDFAAENVFGERRQLTLRQQGNLLDQTLENPGMTDFSYATYMADLRAQHRPDFATFYRYDYRNSSRDNQGSRLDAVVAGLNGVRGETVGYSADSHATRERSEGFRRTIGGARATANYTLADWGFGSLSLGGSWNADRTDQQSTVNQVSVFGEQVVLAGTAPVTLRNPYIVTSTVVVRNLTQTQVYAEGLDYRLVTVGSDVSIQRLLGGNILDGETVRVDYDYEPGGTVTYDSMGQSYSVSTTLLRHLTVFARYQDLRNSIISGRPTQPLNDVRLYEMGATFEHPLWHSFNIGGEVRHTNQDEDIAPYVRDSYSAYLDAPVPGTTSFRLTAYSEKVDNARSAEDVDLVRFAVHVQVRTWGRISCALDADYEQDTGGTLERRRRSQTLGLDWNYRRVRFGLRAQHFDESQGDTTREDSTVRAFIARDF